MGCSFYEHLRAKQVPPSAAPSISYATLKTPESERARLTMILLRLLLHCRSARKRERAFPQTAASASLLPSWLQLE